jgi:hypothetical protein
MASNVSIFESAVGEEPGTSHLYILNGDKACGPMRVASSSASYQLA